MATIDDFNRLDISVGRIIEVEDFPESKKPSYKLKIDFGKGIRIKKSCAQLVKNYAKEQLKDKLVLAVINFQPRQIGPATSEVLTLGLHGKDGECILIEPEREVSIGEKLY